MVKTAGGGGECAARWTDICLSLGPSADTATDKLVIGVLPGEGIGPEVTSCAIDILKVIADIDGLTLDIRYGTTIGRAAEESCGQALPGDVIEFCRQTFAAGGAILNGPGGSRYVYDLRKEFDLFFKISPIQTALGLPDASPFQAEALEGVDILITRENSGGIYQGTTWEERDASRRKVVHHSFSYSETQVTRFLEASARLAATRSGKLTVGWKEHGVKGISGLWRECAAAAASRTGVSCEMVDIDLLTYRLVREPKAFDVIAAPNLPGDVLADLAAVLLGSRGLSFSGNYTESGDGVYQTNHGSAYDLAGTDIANPGGQILSLAMMLRESFGLADQAQAIEEALRDVWQGNIRSRDVSVPGCRLAGTREIGQRVAGRVADLLEASRAAGMTA
ncbi:MAG: isocitrate/isopropylmalate family dehydrogenase [Arenicellales bacterium]